MAYTDNHKAYWTVSYDASCVIAGVWPIQVIIKYKVQNYKVTKINNSEYDTPLEIRYLRHPAELLIIHEVDNSTVYTTEV
jgi:hypothetical protein